MVGQESCVGFGDECWDLLFCIMWGAFFVIMGVVI